MNVTLETYNNKIRMIMPLIDNVYGTASHVAETFGHSDLMLAINYRKVTEITLDVFDHCPEIEAQVAHLIVTRRNGYTRQVI